MSVRHCLAALAVLGWIWTAGSLCARGAEAAVEETPAAAAESHADHDHADHDHADHDHADHDHADHDHVGGHDDHGAEAAHGAGHSEPNPLEVDPDLAIFTAIVFLVLLFVLGKFAWGPIVTALEHREKQIANNIAAAAEKHAEAKELLTDYQGKLAKASDEVRLMLEEARRDAEHTKAEILAEAKAAAQAEHERAMRDVRNATDAALKEIGESGANFAVDLASKILQKELTADDHTRLIRDAVGKFPSRN